MFIFVVARYFEGHTCSRNQIFKTHNICAKCQFYYYLTMLGFGVGPFQNIPCVHDPEIA